LTRPRAAIVVTGSELTRGGRQDVNGPFLARELAGRGLEPERIVVVGDRPEELERALAEGLQADLLVTSGGLGPTHDDRTVEALAKVASRPVLVDEALEEEIEAFSRQLAERFRRPYAEFAEGVRKQASLPEGAQVLGLAGTAPGLVLEVDGSVAVVLPGPPGELRRLWARAVEAEPVRSVFERAQAPRRQVLRFYGVSESAVARAIAEAGGEREGVEATVCAHGGEIEVLLQGAGEGLAGALRRSLAEYLFAEDERPVEELVLEAARSRRRPADVDSGRKRGLPGRDRRLRQRGQGRAARRPRGRAGGPRRRRPGDGGRDGSRRSGGARRRRGGVGHRDRGPRRRDAREAGGARLPVRRRPGGRRGARAAPARGPRADSPPRDRGRAPSPAASSDTES
jgi:molybdenum cofactor synthesis domain-containing protein